MDGKSRFGERLKGLREDQGWTLSEMAERCGLTRMAIHRIERGRSVPSWDTAVKLARLFGVSLDSFESDGVPSAEPAPRKRKGKP